jgi:3-methyladenine DNA glycosylase AlkD
MLCGAKWVGEETMGSVARVMAGLQKKGSEKMRAMYARHGMKTENLYGVSIADLKVIAKTIKGDQALACGLYATGNLDAMYLAGMVADGSKMTKKELHDWATGAAGLQMISEYTVPWVAVENADGRELALKWMKSKEEHVAASGWSTYAGIVATKADADLDLAEIEELLSAVVKGIGGAQNRVRHTMNYFVIAVGTYVRPLWKRAKAVAREMGAVSVDRGDTACKVPSASAYIEKIEAAGRVGRKRKTMRC